MNNDNLSYFNVGKQDLFSKDTVRDLLKKAKDAEMDLKYEKLMDYVDDCIRYRADKKQDGFSLDFHSLPQDEQRDLAKLYLEYTDNDVNYCLIDPSTDQVYTDISEYMLMMLINNSYAPVFNCAVIQRTINYTSQALQTLIYHRCDDLYYEEMDDLGYKQYSDQQTGVTFWRKIA